MPKNSKKPSVKKKTQTIAWYKKPFISLRNAVQESREKNPHRSFTMTRRRDYARELILPKFFAFTSEVTKTLWRNKKIFLPLMVIYIVLYAVLVGAGSQDTYSQLSGSMSQAGEQTFGEEWNALGTSALTFVAVLTNGINGSASEAQQIFSVLLILIAWLSTVWLLRNILAGNKVRVRDGLYNSGAPIIPTLLIGLVIAVQLLPVAIAALGYSAAVSSGLISGGGVEAMLFWIAAGLLTILSLYWITSSLFAMIIVTLPGMYPIKALKTSGSIVLGRRVRLLLRWLWMILCMLLLWLIIMFPIILFDSWIKSVWSAIGWVPIVPIALLLLSTYTVFWITTYIYLLYRKVVENDENA